MQLLFLGAHLGAGRPQFAFPRSDGDFHGTFEQTHAVARDLLLRVVTVGHQFGMPFGEHRFPARAGQRDGVRRIRRIQHGDAPVFVRPAFGDDRRVDVEFVLGVGRIALPVLAQLRRSSGSAGARVFHGGRRRRFGFFHLQIGGFGVHQFSFPRRRAVSIFAAAYSSSV